MIGFIETRNRNLKVRKICHYIVPGNLLLFNPGENHSCESRDRFSRWTTAASTFSRM
ncbi:MAG: hypothetical protein R2881_10040 [Eubacteriales bacterium]